MSRSLHSLLSAIVLLPSLGAAININEIHYNPPENPIRQEFIELYNSGPDEVVLSGWRLSGAIDYLFPADTTIAGGEFFVIAEDPAVLQSTLGASAIGPFLGKLNAEGETVRLRNEADLVVDEVDYRVGFPWPVEASGNGPSIELINPALDNSLGSSWRSASRPSPGAQNTVFSPNTAPNIRKVKHTPQQPTDADVVVITSKVSDPDGVASVLLEYQIVAAGFYLPSQLPLRILNNTITIRTRANNPAYQEGWVGLVMTDDGTGDDALADDGIFTATLPAQAHRTLMRYRITVEDSLAASVRVPYSDDPSANFAYFVYNGIPTYEGLSPAVLESLPVYHLITREEDYEECFAYNSSDRINQGSEARFLYNWNGTIVYDGVVYDNIRYRLRGANGRYHNQGKRSMRFRFNDGSYFQARDQEGKKYSKKWRTLTTGKGFDNRGTLTYALNEAMSMRLFNEIGVPGPRTHWIHWRVVDDSAEAPDRWRGDFQGMNFVLETYDVRFMEAHGLEKGNLYKLINQTQDWRRQQRYQAAAGARNGADHIYIESTLTGNTSEREILESLNVERWNHWHALAEAMRIYDFWPSANKNMVYYFEPTYTPGNRGRGKLWILPWDTDASWGPTWNSGHDVVYNALFAASGGGSDGGSTPGLWPDYFNTVREVRDLLWQRDQISPVLRELVSDIRFFERADGFRWKGAPSDAGNYGGLGGQGAVSLGLLERDMINFGFLGGSWPGGGVGAGGRGAHLDTLQASQGEGGRIPGTPTIRYTGTAEFPSNGLQFESSAFSDPQGNQSFGAMEWRVSEITDSTAPAHDSTAPFKLEWKADWESGELSVFSASKEIPTTAVRSGHTYRARVRHQDNTGRWSHWSAPLKFTVTLPDISALRQGLVISELMYHPGRVTPDEILAGYPDDDFFEFIELRNVGPTPLDLSDVRFTKGVDYDFTNAAISTLDPGKFVLIVAKRTAYEMRYGAEHPIAGEWDPTDKLDNGGEQVKLSFGAGDAIRDFIYDDLAPWPSSADGHGFSLTLIDPSSVPDHTLPSSWRASYAEHGTTNADEPSSPFDLWMAANAATDPAASYHGHPLSNLIAYAVGTDLAPTPGQSAPEIIIVADGGTNYPALRFRQRQNATDFSLVVEISDKLLTWQSGPAITVEAEVPQDNGDGTVTRIVRTLQPHGTMAGQYLRLRVSP